MLGIGVWVVLAAAPLIAARIWVSRNRDRYTLAQLFELGWWMWPLARLAIHRWKLAAHHDKLWKYAGYDEADPPRRPYYITIRGWERDGFTIRRLEKPPCVILRLASGFPHGDEEVDGNKNPKKELVAQARGEFGLGLVDYDYPERPWRRRVVITPKLVVPTEAMYADEDVRQLVDEFLTPTTFVPAIGRGEKPHLHSLLDDAPHSLISGTTGGGGKSSMLRTIGVQAYQMGHHVLIVDPVKKVSHLDWAIDLDTERPWPGIYYVNSFTSAARSIVAAGKLIGRRGKVAEARILKGETVEFPRLVILMDDMNGLMSEFRRRSHDNARHYLSILLWAGREPCLNIFAAFQRASARAAVDGDVRTCFGCRVIADGSESIRKMIADEVDRKDMPKILPQSIQPGHSAWVYGSRVVEAQRIFYEPEEARDICRAAAKRRVARHQVALPGLRALNPPPVDVPAQPNGSGRPGQPARQAKRQAQDSESGHDNDRTDEAGLTGHGSVGHPLLVEQGRHTVEHEDEGQDEDDFHVTHTSTRRALVKLQSGDRDTRGEDQGAYLEENVHHAPTLRGLSSQATDESSMQAIEGGFDIDRTDGGIEYLTLRRIVEFEWCQFGEKTLGRYLRDPEKLEPFVEAGGTDCLVIPGRRGMPARFSMRAVQDFCEFLDAGGKGNPGVYVFQWPESATVKIGETLNVRRRRKTFQLPESCLLLWVPRGSKRAAQELETALHDEFRGLHIELEWFRYEGRLVDWVEGRYEPRCLREKVRT